MTQKIIYFAEKLLWQESIEGIRHRPRMYIGSTDTQGLFVMCRELINHATHEAIGGYANCVTVRLLPDKFVSVENNGCGISIEIHPESGRRILEMVMTEFHQSPHFALSHRSVGMDSVGNCVVNALSAKTLVEVKRAGKLWRQEYSRGIPQADVILVGEIEGSGIAITYQADETIFGTAEFDVALVRQRLRELSYLVPTCKFTLKDCRVTPPLVEEYNHPGGLADFVSQLNSTQMAVFKVPFHFCGGREDKTSADNMGLEVAIQYNKSDSTTLIAFCNSIHNSRGGLHESGVKLGIMRALNQFAREKNVFSGSDLDLQVEDICLGLIASVSVSGIEPIFAGSTKERLAGPRFIEEAVASLVHERFAEYLQANAKIAASLVEKTVANARSRTS